MNPLEMAAAPAVALPSAGVRAPASSATAVAPSAARGRSALVVGAGMGGLASAVRLAHAGVKVTVLERAPRAGGRAGRWESEGFVFDTGPSLVLMTEYWQKLFASVGRRFEDYVNLVQIDPNYRVHFPDGSSLEMTSVLNRFLANVEEIEPGARLKAVEYLAHTGTLYDAGLKFISRNMSKPSDMLKLDSLGSLATLGALGDLQKLVRKYFKDERLQQALSFQSLYLGLSPYDALAIYALLPYTELAGGVHYPMGGIYELPRALERLGRELGVEYVYDAKVATLEKAADRVTGAVLEDGRRFTADAVLVNADLPYAYDRLLGEPYPNIEKKKFSCSVVLMYIGTNREYPQLEHHNFWVSPDMPKFCEQMFEQHVMPDEPPFYLVATTRTDPSGAPPGCENLFLLVLAPSQHPDPAKRIDWSVKGPEVEARMLEKLERDCGLTDLRKHIVTKRLVTPTDFTIDYGNLRGEAFGLSHNLLQIGYFRPQNRHPKYGNLFFVGQSTHPGCGVPMALISAECVVERMVAEFATR